MSDHLTTEPGQRGPAEHERREQILRAADEHFRHYGYSKTTVADLAKAIGVSAAYVYRFFESKQAIGEAVCAMTLGRIDDALLAIAREDGSAADRLKRVYRCLAEQGLELFFHERKLHELTIVAVTSRWSSIARHKTVMFDAVRRIVEDGRRSGEFENETPLEETCRAIFETLEPFAHPMLLELKQPPELDSAVVAVANLVLRSLAP